MGGGHGPSPTFWGSDALPAEGQFPRQKRALPSDEGNFRTLCTTPTTPSRLAWPRLPVLREQGTQRPSPGTGTAAAKFTVNKQSGDVRSVPGKSLATCQRATAGAQALECPEGLGTKPREGRGPPQVPRKGGEAPRR